MPKTAESPAILLAKTAPVLLLAFVLAFVGAFLRNHAVYHERLRIIELIHDAGTAELDAAKAAGAFSPEWFAGYDRRQEFRRSQFARVSYQDMLLRFWTPARRFFDEASIRAGAPRGELGPEPKSDPVPPAARP